MRIPDLRVLTSRLRRTIATARGVEAPQEHVAALNELHAGICEGLSYEEMQEHYPQVIQNPKQVSTHFKTFLWINSLNLYHSLIHFIQFKHILYIYISRKYLYLSLEKVLKRKFLKLNPKNRLKSFNFLKLSCSKKFKIIQIYIVFHDIWKSIFSIQEFAWRDQDKLRYRYPWGESYIDAMQRVEPIIAELQRSDNVLVVSHQAILRCIIGFFMDKKPEELPYMEVPLHTIIRVSSQGYNYKLEFFKLPIECVNTTRVKPNNCSADRSADDALITVPPHFDIPDPWRNPGSGPTLVQQHWETARRSTISSKIRSLFGCNFKF